MMILLTETEFNELKEKLKKEITNEINQENLLKKESYYSLAQKEYKKIFDECFDDLEIDNNRNYKIKASIINMTNVFRGRVKTSPKPTSDRGCSIRSEEEYQCAIETYRKVCEFAKTIYCEDFIGEISLYPDK